MNKYAGKARIGVIAILGAAALAIVGLHRSSGRAYSATSTPTPAGPTLFVTDRCSDAVTAYPATSNGDASPLAPAPPGLSRPWGVVIDASGNIYAANSCNGTITIYAKGSNGPDAAPIAIIGGSNTRLYEPEGIALDSSRNIYVADAGAASVFVYPALGGSTGLLNETPTATISGSNTGLEGPYGIALDSSGEIYVTDDGATSVFVYPKLGSSTGLLNEAPTATIGGSNTGLTSPYGIALDSSGEIYVTDDGATSVFVYPKLGAAPGCSTKPPPRPSAGATRACTTHKASRWIPAATSTWLTGAPAQPPTACLSIRRWEAAPGNSTRPPPPAFMGANRA